MRRLLVADAAWTGAGQDVQEGPVVVEVVDDRIAAVDALRGPRPRGPGVLDLGASVVLPGLVNAHAHTPMTLMRGVAQGHSLLTLEGWQRAVRSREAFLEPAMTTASVEVACAEMAASGTTAFADQYFFAEHYLPVVERSGLRATVAYGIVELGDDDARAEGLAAAARFVEQSQQHPLVRGWVGPHAFFVDNQLDAIEAEMALARRFGVGLHAHFATSGEEDLACRQRYGMRALAMMERIGLLDVPLLLAHANAVRREELPLLAGRDVTLVVAPSVGMVSGAAAMPVRQALDVGVNVAVGTDNLCNNNNADMFEELRTLGKLAAFTEQRPNVITPEELLDLGTRRGHVALQGGPADGRLVPGAVADLVAFPVAALHRGPVGAQSLAAALVYGANGFDTTTVVVAGQDVKRGGKLLTFDPVSAARRQQEDWDRLAAAAAAGSPA